MEDRDLKKMIQVAKLYYENDIKQDQIAFELGISRPQVSRLIAKAKQLGYIQIQVIDPFDKIRIKEIEVAKKYNLKEVRIANLNEDETVKQSLGKTAGKFLKEILKPNDIIGVSWGTTLYEMVRYFQDPEVPGVTVVQLKGSATNNAKDFYTFGIVSRLAEILKGKMYYLPIPVMVESKEVKEALLRDPNISNVLELGRKANIAIFSIGYPSKDSIIAQSGYLTADQLEAMREDGAVGDICSRFFKLDGTIYDQSIDDRTTSIPLEAFKNKEYSIGIAGGRNNVNSILGALNGGYINTLITDIKSANILLEI